MIFQSDSTKLTVNNDVVDIWKTYRQNTLWKKEACGILIGSSNEEETEIQFEMATIPMKKDYSSRNNFKILDPYHQYIVDKEWKESLGRLFLWGFGIHIPKKPLILPLWIYLNGKIITS